MLRFSLVGRGGWCGESGGGPALVSVHVVRGGWVDNISWRRRFLEIIWISSHLSIHIIRGARPLTIEDSRAAVTMQLLQSSCQLSLDRRWIACKGSPACGNPVLVIGVWAEIASCTGRRTRMFSMAGNMVASRMLQAAQCGG